jgi:hypothetical protein
MWVTKLLSAFKLKNEIHCKSKFDEILFNIMEGKEIARKILISAQFVILA